jgi:hypothetical protein
MSKENPTPSEIREAIDYLRGERDKPSTELELTRKELERDRNFMGCVGIVAMLFITATLGALVSGHPGGGVILLTVSALLGYLVWHGRKEVVKKNRELEELKKEKGPDTL